MGESNWEKEQHKRELSEQITLLGDTIRNSIEYQGEALPELSGLAEQLLNLPIEGYLPGSAKKSITFVKKGITPRDILPYISLWGSPLNRNILEYSSENFLGLDKPQQSRVLLVLNSVQEEKIGQERKLPDGAIDELTPSEILSLVQKFPDDTVAYRNGEFPIYTGIAAEYWESFDGKPRRTKEGNLMITWRHSNKAQCPVLISKYSGDQFTGYNAHITAHRLQI